MLGVGVNAVLNWVDPDVVSEKVKLDCKLEPVKLEAQVAHGELSIAPGESGEVVSIVSPEVASPNVKLGWVLWNVLELLLELLGGLTVEFFAPALVVESVTEGDEVELVDKIMFDPILGLLVD